MEIIVFILSFMFFSSAAIFIARLILKKGTPKNDYYTVYHTNKTSDYDYN